MKVCNEVSLSRISDMLCSAFEGGSNYWYEITKFNEPPKMEFLSSPDLNDGKPFPHIDYPLNKGGSLVIRCIEGDRINGKTHWKLDLAAIRKGLQLMAEKSPRHYANFVNEDDDAETGDVFLQYCLFGEVIFG